MLLCLSHVSVTYTLWQRHWKLQCVTHCTLLHKQLYWQRFIATSCWSGSGLRLRPHHHHCPLAEIPPGHPTAALSPADPAALLPQDGSLQGPQKLTDAGDVGWAWVVAELVSPGLCQAPMLPVRQPSSGRDSPSAPMTHGVSSTGPSDINMASARLRAAPQTTDIP